MQRSEMFVPIELSALRAKGTKAIAARDRLCLWRRPSHDQGLIEGLHGQKESRQEQTPDGYRPVARSRPSLGC